MHTYYNPAPQIREIGRPVSGATFAELANALGDGEVLFELLHRPDRVEYAVLMNSQETFDEFKALSVTHPYTSLGYFAVPWSDAEDGADEPVDAWLPS